MASKLSTLPTELIELIASALEPIDLCSLRLVCKEVHKNTTDCFGHTCLTTFRTDLSRKNLQKLEELSRQKHLRHHVQTLLIKDLRDDLRQFYGLGEGFSLHRHPSGYLLDPLPGVQMLQGILLNRLLNCRSFYIYSDYASEESYESGLLMPSDAVGIILAIIAETSLPVKSFSVDFLSHGTGSFDAQRLHMPQYRKPEFRTGWAHLQELSLEQSMKSDAFDWAMDLVLHATGLRKLSLDFQHQNSASFIDRLSLTERLPGLQELQLSGASLTVETISGFLLRFCNSLRALTFRHVHIESGGTWVSVLKVLRSDLPLLERVCVDWIRELNSRESEVYPGAYASVMFPKLSDNPVVPGSQGRRFKLREKKRAGEKRIVGASYHGPEMHVALGILASSAETI
ncbi:hypothetical protein MMC08_007544 [Hypocenomyce scalaris]|nr:hypothetical protein [Hypocenomyce scalaris]